jgi:hypothetical protein
VCLVLNVIALVRCRSVETWMPLNVGWLGVFIAPTTKNGRWKCSVAWRTGQSGAPATSVCHWGSTVGALSCGPAWPSGGAPDRPCRLSDVPPARALLLCARWRAFNVLQSTVACEVVVAPLAHRTVRCYTRQSGEF